ncbi:hypothetical protein [Longirhabdus pacifica]|uniref:hypothetical protein n=1 Tax=Longirhabdus pacifica TaxID=2305227 RepID=UPI0010091331|nr:hypothetical protein [Longirhabdus pacifica]
MPKRTDETSFLLPLGAIIVFPLHFIATITALSMTITLFLWMIMLAMWVALIYVMIQKQKQVKTKNYVSGMFRTYYIHLSIALLFTFGYYYLTTVYIHMAFIFLVGIYQIVYIAPMILIFSIVNKTFMQGIILGAIVTFLLNAACFGLIVVLE